MRQKDQTEKGMPFLDLRVTWSKEGNKLLVEKPCGFKILLMFALREMVTEHRARLTLKSNFLNI